MSDLLYKVFLLFLLASGVFADCELVEDNNFLAHEEFKEAEALHENLKYSEAYDMLLKSYQTYPNDSSEIELAYECVNYIPGPYAPTIKHSSKHEMFDFNRNALGISIKHQLSPAPYVFIQFQKNKTIVSAINSVTTARNTIEKRLPLENFVVHIDSEQFDFNNLEVGKLETRSANKNLSINSNITTTEKFGFKLYK